MTQLQVVEMGMSSSIRAKKPQHSVPIYKQQNTTLQASSRRVHPLEPTPSYPYSSTVAYAYENTAEKDAALRVTFERVPDGPAEMNTLLVEINTPNSYNVHLNMVNEFRRCSEAAKRLVGVDIILGL